MSNLLDAELPIAAAPMAGGPSSPALVNAAGAAGAFAFLPAGYRSPAAFAEDLAAVRSQGRPFGVNLFVPQADEVDRAAFRTYAAELAPEAAAYDLTLDPTPRTDDDYWHQKIDLLTSDPVAVVSLTFGLPDPADIRALQRAGSRVLATITTPDEARRAAEAAIDGLVVQGPRAGGHSATYDPRREIGDEPTADVIAAVAAAVDLPLIAAGGVDGPETVRELIAAGAQSVAVGTLLLRSFEAGTSATHRAALADPAFTETVITRAFTGQPARGLRNGFIDRHEATAPVGYPAVHHLTRALRQAAARAGDAQRVHLWAGTAFRGALERPTADIIADLATRL